MIHGFTGVFDFKRKKRRRKTAGFLKGFWKCLKKKNMSQTEKSHSSRIKARSIVGFYPAQLRCTKSDGYYIEYNFVKSTQTLVGQRLMMHACLGDTT